MNNINKMIDHTLLKPNATEKEIINLTNEAKKYNFFSVCVNSTNLKIAQNNLKGSDVKVCCVAGFPLGASNLETKLAEVKWLVDNGCDEVDFVVNVGHIKDKKYNLVEDEFKQIRKITKGHTIKVILETCYLTKDEIVEVCKIADSCNIDFVKTSTGFGSGGALVEDVELMKKSISSKTQVKASGGVRSYDDAIKMINAGATRLGTSNGIAIVDKTTSGSDY